MHNLQKDSRTRQLRRARAGHGHGEGGVFRQQQQKSCTTLHSKLERRSPFPAAEIAVRETIKRFVLLSLPNLSTT